LARNHDTRDITSLLITLFVYHYLLSIIPFQVVSDGKSGQLVTVNLTRTSRGRIGLLLKEDDDGVILVDDVVPGEPASVEGNLKHGDVIVEVIHLCQCYQPKSIARAGISAPPMAK
jgi:hypothetical protein